MLLISRKNNETTEPGFAVASGINEQDQRTLRELYQVFDVVCDCVGSEGIRMHVKHRAPSSDVSERFWLADNPGAPEHDVECPMFANKQFEERPEGYDTTDPYRLREAVQFRIPSEKDNTPASDPQAGAVKAAAGHYQQSLSRRLLFNAYDAALANYYFGQPDYSVEAVAAKIKRSSFAQEQVVNGEPLAKAIVYGRRGLSMLRRDIKDRRAQVRLWFHVANKVEVTATGLRLDDEWFPTKKMEQRSISKGPYMVVCLWALASDGRPQIQEVETVMIADENLCLPVGSQSERDLLVRAGARVQRERDEKNKLFLSRGLLPDHQSAMVGLKVSGTRERMVVSDWLTDTPVVG